MKFSIITITYNSEAYLEETIASVLSQEYDDFEYILIDGGSTDGTVDIIRRHAEQDRRIRWISEPDEGISDAFNKGIRMASGDIIGIINSDDKYIPGALQLVAESLAMHPDSDVFHGNMTRSQSNTVLYLIKPSDVERNIWHEMPINTPAMFVTRRAYQAVGFYDTNLKLAMDYDLVLRLYRAGYRFLHIDKALANMSYGGVSDERFLDALREVRMVAVRQGAPRAKVYAWFIYKSVSAGIKYLLRRLGLHSLIRLHPKFSSCKD
jgi:glycosyltransferase involved in cell wall biosynthesis